MSDDVFDELRDLEAFPVGADEAVDFEDWIRLSYPPGDYERQVHKLDPEDRAKWSKLVADRPAVAGTLWQAEAQAAQADAGADGYCRRWVLEDVAHALAAHLGLGFAAGDQWVFSKSPHAENADLPFIMLARIWDSLPPCGCNHPWWIAFATMGSS